MRDIHRKCVIFFFTTACCFLSRTEASCDLSADQFVCDGKIDLDTIQCIENDFNIRIAKNSGISVSTRACGESSLLLQTRCGSGSIFEELVDCSNIEVENRILDCDSDFEIKVNRDSMDLIGDYLYFTPSNLFSCTASCPEGTYPERVPFGSVMYACKLCNLPTEEDLLIRTNQKKWSGNEVYYYSCDSSKEIAEGSDYKLCSEEGKWLGSLKYVRSREECNTERVCTPRSMDYWIRYRDSTSMECKACPYNISKSVEAYKFAEVCACPAGQEARNEACVFCEEGKYRSETMDACSPCSEDSTLLFGASTCLSTCPSGMMKVLDNSEKCSNCPRKISELMLLLQHRNETIEIPTNATHTRVQMNPDACKGILQDAKINTDAFYTLELPCTARQHIVNSTGVCLDCATGHYPRKYGHGCIPQNCFHGTWDFSESRCLYLSSTQYDLDNFDYPLRNSSGQWSSRKCSIENKTSDMYFEGAINLLQNSDSWLVENQQNAPCNYTCDRGFELVAGVGCRKCGPGLKKEIIGNGACSQCSPGTFSSQWEGSTDCTQCGVGKFSLERQHVCTPCYDVNERLYTMQYLWRLSEYSPGVQNAESALESSIRETQQGLLPNGVDSRTSIDGYVFSAESSLLCNPTTDFITGTCNVQGGRNDKPNCQRCNTPSESVDWQCAEVDYDMCIEKVTYRDYYQNGTSYCRLCSEFECTNDDEYHIEGDCNRECLSCLLQRQDISQELLPSSGRRTGPEACRFGCPIGTIQREMVQKLLEYENVFLTAPRCVDIETPNMLCPALNGLVLGVETRTSMGPLIKCTRETSKECGSVSSALPIPFGFPREWFRDRAGGEVGPGIFFNLSDAFLHELGLVEESEDFFYDETPNGLLGDDSHLPAHAVAVDTQERLWRIVVNPERKCQCPSGMYGDVVANGDYLCTECPKGRTSHIGSTTSAQCYCDIGYYTQDCIPCPVGMNFVCPGGPRGQTQECEENTQVTQTHAFSTYYHCIPNVGYERLYNGSITECFAGIEQQTLTLLSGGCTHEGCRGGAFFDTEQWGCVCDYRNGFKFDFEERMCICQEGYFSEGNACLECIPGSYCPGGGIRIGCEDALSLTPARATHKDSCTCPGGYYMDENDRCVNCPSENICVDNNRIQCTGIQDVGYYYRMTCLNRGLSRPNACPPGCIYLNPNFWCRNYDFYGDYSIKPQAMTLVNLHTVHENKLYRIPSSVSKDGDWFVLIYVDETYSSDTRYRWNRNLLIYYRKSTTVAAGLQSLCVPNAVIVHREESPDTIKEAFVCEHVPSNLQIINFQSVSQGLALLGPNGMTDPFRKKINENPKLLLSHDTHLQWNLVYSCPLGKTMRPGSPYDVTSACFYDCKVDLVHVEGAVELLSTQNAINTAHAPVDAVFQMAWSREFLSIVVKTKYDHCSVTYVQDFDPGTPLDRGVWEAWGMNNFDGSSCLKKSINSVETWRPGSWASGVVWYRRKSYTGAPDHEIPHVTLADPFLNRITHAQQHEMQGKHFRSGDIIKDDSGKTWIFERELRHHTPQTTTSTLYASGRIVVDFYDSVGGLVRRIIPKMNNFRCMRIMAVIMAKAWAYTVGPDTLPAGLTIACDDMNNVRIFSCSAFSGECLTFHADSQTESANFCAAEVQQNMHHIYSDMWLIATGNSEIWAVPLTKFSAFPIAKPVVEMKRLILSKQSTVLGFGTTYSYEKDMSLVVNIQENKMHTNPERYTCVVSLSLFDAKLEIDVSEFEVKTLEMKDAGHASVDFSVLLFKVQEELREKYHMSFYHTNSQNLQCHQGKTLSPNTDSCQDNQKVLLLCLLGDESVFVLTHANFASGEIEDYHVVGVRRLHESAHMQRLAIRLTPSPLDDKPLIKTLLHVSVHVELSYLYTSNTGEEVARMERFHFDCQECPGNMIRNELLSNKTESDTCKCESGTTLVCLPCDEFCLHQSVTWNVSGLDCHHPLGLYDTERAYVSCQPCTGGATCPENQPVACEPGRFSDGNLFIGSKACMCAVNHTKFPRNRLYIGTTDDKEILQPAGNYDKDDCQPCDIEREICHPMLGARESLICPTDTDLVFDTKYNTNCANGLLNCKATHFVFTCRCKYGVAGSEERREYFTPEVVAQDMFMQDWNRTALQTERFLERAQYTIVIEQLCGVYQAPTSMQTEWDVNPKYMFQESETSTPKICPSPFYNRTVNSVTDKSLAVTCKQACNKQDGFWITNGHCMPIPNGSIVSNQKLLPCPKHKVPNPQNSECVEAKLVASVGCNSGFFLVLPSSSELVRNAIKSYIKTDPPKTTLLDDYTALESLRIFLDKTCFGETWDLHLLSEEETQPLPEGSTKTKDGTRRIFTVEKCQNGMTLTEESPENVFKDSDGLLWKPRLTCAPCLLGILDCPGGLRAPRLKSTPRTISTGSSYGINPHLISCPRGASTVNTLNSIPIRDSIGISSCFNGGTLWASVPSTVEWINHPWPGAIYLNTQWGQSEILSTILNDLKTFQNDFYFSELPQPTIHRLGNTIDYLIVGTIDVARVITSDTTTHAHMNPHISKMLDVPIKWARKINKNIKKDQRATALVIPGGLLWNNKVSNLVYDTIKNTGGLPVQSAVAFSGNDEAIRRELGESAYILHTTICHTENACPVLISTLDLSWRITEHFEESGPLQPKHFTLSEYTTCPLGFRDNQAGGTQGCARCDNGACNKCRNTSSDALQACNFADSHWDGLLESLSSISCDANGVITC